MFLPAGCTIRELFERLRGGDEAPLSDERKDRAWARLTQLASSDEFVFVKSPLPETAYDEIDSFCPLPKQYWMLKVIRHLHESILRVVDDDTDLDRIAQLDVVAAVARMRSWAHDGVDAAARELMGRIDDEVSTL